MFDRDSFLKNLLNLPGVYRMLNAAGQVIYVGKAVSLRKRVVSYFRAQIALSPRVKLMVGEIASVEITVTRSESEALLLENNLIKTLTPRYNILFRDDKSYPYILLSKHKYPRIGFFRGTPNKSDQVFGPFPNAAAVRESIGFIQKVFRIRTCEDSVFSNRTRPCLLHQINRCTAPCVNKISEAGYGEHITNAKLMLHGKGKEIVEHLSGKMHESAASQHYEEAALYRDQIHNLTKVQETQFVSNHKSIDSDIVVAVSSKGAICVNLTMVRGGMHLGDRSFFPQNVHDGDLKSSLEAFATQHYLTNPAPPQIVLSEAVTIEGLEEVLSKQCAYVVKIITKPNATQKVWLQMASKNAQLALSQSLSQAANDAHTPRMPKAR